MDHQNEGRVSLCLCVHACVWSCFFFWQYLVWLQTYTKLERSCCALRIPNPQENVWKNSSLRAENDHVFVNKFVTKLLPISLRLVSPHAHSSHLIFLMSLKYTFHHAISVYYNLYQCLCSVESSRAFFKGRRMSSVN